MPKRKAFPIALTIAGSDSGGGAGIQADLKTFAALGVHGTSVITCVTAQNPAKVLGVEACSVKIIEAQLKAMADELPPAAIKTGMLFSSEIIRAVARWAAKQKVSLVVDPVMVATSGARLLAPDAIAALMKELLPRARIVTPNLPEAEALLGFPIRDPEEMRSAARELQARFGCAALVKGGHLGRSTPAIDIFWDGKTELMLSAPRVRGVKTHGTGCTYSAAIAAYLARGEKLAKAVELAKDFVTSAIAGGETVHGYHVLNHSGAGRALR